MDHKLKFSYFFLIVSGKDIQHPETFYVSVENNLIKVDSLKAGVKLCFQIIKTFRKEFPVVSNHVWSFLSNTVFCVHEKTNKPISDLIQELQSTQEELSM